MKGAIDLARNTLNLYIDGAPWLLFGLLVVGLIAVCLPKDALQRWRRA